MQDQKPQRGPRGRYARLICQGCRSRKIKCFLPNPDDINPVPDTPQPPDKACERCRSFGLDCIVERTLLGRPAARRNQGCYHQHQKSRASRGVSELGLGSGSASIVKNDGEDLSPGLNGIRDDGDGGDGDGDEDSNLEIRKYLYADVPDDEDIGSPTPGSTRSEDAAFQSMVSPHALMSMALAKDQSFGTDIPRATSRWNKPLSSVVSDDMAASWDGRLVWHRFFHPQLPTLASLRKELSSSQSAATNSATNLLFALLCLTACEAAGRSTIQQQQQQQPHLKRNLQLAVASYGEEFVLSPPTHRHSIALCLFLCDYKPTALTTLQSVVHKAIKSELYINLAWRIAERLGMMTAHGPDSSSVDALRDPNCVDFEPCLTESTQKLQIICRDSSIDGYLLKPSERQRHVLAQMKPYVDAYQVAVRSGVCSPRAIFLMQLTTGTYIMLRTIADAKQNWNDAERLLSVVEDAQRECLEQTKFSNCLLVDASKCFGQYRVEITAARSLLELYFHILSVNICGLGILFSSVLSSRLQSGKMDIDLELHSHEALQIAIQVIRDSAINAAREWERSGGGNKATIRPFSMFVGRFGKDYPDRLMVSVEMFIECTKLELNETALQPTFPQFVLSIIDSAKNIVENNLIRVRRTGCLHPDFDKQVDLFRRCASRLDAIATSPSAFEGGCVYAASSKIIIALLRFMITVRARLEKRKSVASKKEQRQQSQHSHAHSHSDANPNPLDSNSNYDNNVPDQQQFDFGSTAATADNYYWNDIWTPEISSAWEATNSHPFLHPSTVSGFANPSYDGMDNIGDGSAAFAGDVEASFRDWGFYDWSQLEAGLEFDANMGLGDNAFNMDIS